MSRRDPNGGGTRPLRPLTPNLAVCSAQWGAGRVYTTQWGARETGIWKRTLSSVWQMGLRNGQESNKGVVRSSFKQTTVALAVGRVGRLELSGGRVQSA